MDHAKKHQRSSKFRKSRHTKDVVGDKSDVSSSTKSRKSRKSEMKKATSGAAVAVIAAPRPTYAESSSAAEIESLLEELDFVEPQVTPPVSEEKCHRDFVAEFTRLIAEDFWETAWDICETRFIHENASQIIVSDLRDTWLSIMEMEWEDTDPSLLEKAKFPMYEDSVPLPPKFDFWSHGALEPLPRTCRESVMDPFLRDPMPWFMEKSEQDGQQLEAESAEQIIDVVFSRPTSPIPISSEEGDNTIESAWSMASTTAIKGSCSNSQMSLPFDDAMHNDNGPRNLLDSSERSDACPTCANRNEPTKVHSIELIYPSKKPAAEIRASTEISYKLGGGVGISDFRKSGGELSNELVAFKLPQQTSSESRQAHHERKKQSTKADQ